MTTFEQEWGEVLLWLLAVMWLLLCSFSEQTVACSVFYQGLYPTNFPCPLPYIGTRFTAGNQHKKQESEKSF